MVDNAEINKHFNDFTDHEIDIQKLVKVAFDNLVFRIILLNAGGLTAILAFTGVILTGLAVGPYLYPTILSFGIGLLCGVIIFIADLINLYIPMYKFKKTREQLFCAELVQKVVSGEAFKDALKMTWKRSLLRWISRMCLIFSCITFILGMILGCLLLSDLIKSSGEQKLAAVSYTLINLNTFNS